MNDQSVIFNRGGDAVPKIVDKEKRRGEIARSAMELFARKGFETSSVREITQAAGMAKGSLYDYFSDKNDLLLEIARIIFSSWKERMAKRMASTGDPLEQISILIREGGAATGPFEQFILLYVDIWRLSVKGGDYRQFHILFRSFLKETKAMAAAVLERGKKEGALRGDIDADATAASIVAFIDGLLLHFMAMKPGFSVTDTAAAFHDALLRGISARG